MTIEFGCGTSFWESRKSCGHDNGGCHDSELAGMSAAVTWVLWDICGWYNVSSLGQMVHHYHDSVVASARW